MTYKELVNAIQTIVENHYQLQGFGYGDLSDIKANIQEQRTNYPYVFLNPQPHTRLERSTIYRFNMIVMDMALNEDHLTVQSDCQQYIDDILAEIKYNLLNRYDINVNFNLAPFNERFQDTVAGMTLTLALEVPNPLNLCIAPIEPQLGDLVSYTYTNNPEIDNDFHMAISRTNDYVNFPEWDWQYERFGPWFYRNAPYNYSRKEDTEVINDTNTIYFSVGAGELFFRQGVEGTYRINLDLELKNVQGVTFDASDLFRMRVFRSGTEIINQPLNIKDILPVDGTVVPWSFEFDVETDISVEDEVRFIFQFTDTAPFLPAGPLVGYRGTFKVYELI